MTYVLADTSVWIDHFRDYDPMMGQLAEAKRLMMHPFIIGELSMGNLHNRGSFLRQLKQMRSVAKVDDVEVFALVEAQRLHGTGIGWVDAHLLTSVLLMDDVRLWTRDRRLNAAAERLGRAAQLHH